jgi:ABC-type phosphate transport system substrate-binding protein
MRRFALALIVLGLIGLFFPMMATAAPAAALQPPACPAGYECQLMPTATPGAPQPGDVQIGPVNGLDPPGAGTQSIYVHLYDFPPGDPDVEVYLCANPGGTTTVPATPLCATGGDNTDNNGFDAPVNLPIYPESSPPSASAPPGTTEFSEAIPQVSAPATPIPAFNPPGGASGPSFYCDANDPCAIEVVDSSINQSRTPSSANTVVTPLTYAASSNGCPQSTFINTESEFGIDLLMPILSRLACVPGTSPAVALNTAFDGLHAVTDLATPGSGIQVAFTDDPQSPDEQKVLNSGHFALIPIGLTADVIAFLSQFRTSTGQDFPQSALDLTPTMVAGLVTDDPIWPGAQNSDNQASCVGPSSFQAGCAVGPPCFGSGTKADTCSLYLQSNFVDGYKQFEQNTAVDRSDPSGTTDTLTHWLCGATTNVIINLGGKINPTETQTAPQVLISSLNDQFAKPKLKTCPVTDTFPNLSGLAGVITVGQPGQQALKIYTGVYGNTAEAYAGFAPMNWATANYYGMSVASLQNAAGSFVYPSATSLDAAVNDATTNADGTLAFHNDASDPVAYPMTSMFYAAVSTDPMDPGQATSMKLMLNQLLSLTGGADTADLPTGFVPLPSALYAEAQTDIAKDIVAAPTPPPPPPPTTTQTTVPTAPTSPVNSSAPAPTTPIVNTVAPESNYALPSFVSLPAPPAVAPPFPGISTTTTAHRPPLLGPDLPGFTLLASRQQLLFPASQTVAIATTAFGVLLLMAATLRRRLRRKPAVAASDGE